MPFPSRKRRKVLRQVRRFPKNRQTCVAVATLTGLDARDWTSRALLRRVGAYDGPDSFDSPAGSDPCSEIEITPPRHAIELTPRSRTEFTEGSGSSVDSTSPSTGSSPDKASASAPTPASRGCISQLADRLRVFPAIASEIAGHLPSNSPVPGEASVLDISNDAAQLVLAEYRRIFMPLFPFVWIDETTDALQLCQDKPFLFSVIMFVACRVSLQRKKLMQKEVMAHLGQHLLVHEHRELDLLQGLLVFIAW